MDLSYKEKQELKLIEQWEKKYINKINIDSSFNISHKFSKFRKKQKTRISLNKKNIKIAKSPIKKSIQNSIMHFMNFGLNKSKYSFDKEISIKKLKRKDIETVEDLYKADVTDLEKFTKNIIAKHEIFGVGKEFADVASDFLPVVGGISLSLAEIPMILSLSFKTMQQIACVYGYNPEDDREKLFMLKLLSLSNAYSSEKKATLLRDIEILKEDMKKYTYKVMEDKYEKYSMEVVCEETAKICVPKFSVNTTLKSIPLAGEIFSEICDFEFLSNLAELANKMYKKRFLEDKLEKENISTPKKDPISMKFLRL